MNSISGIYKIVNKKNGHKYIGSAIDLQKRERDHFTALQRGSHHSIYLQRAYNKYGKDNFVFEIIEICKKEDLIKNEQRYFEEYCPEYNIAPHAGSQLGYKHSDDSKKKMSEKAKGRTFTEEIKEKLRSALIGKKRDKSIGEKISKANKGRFMSPEWIDKIRKSNTGKKHTPEHCAKIGNAHLGRKNTPETIEKMRKSALARIERKKAENGTENH